MDMLIESPQCGLEFDLFFEILKVEANIVLYPDEFDRNSCGQEVNRHIFA